MPIFRAKDSVLSLNKLILLATKAVLFHINFVIWVTKYARYGEASLQLHGLGIKINRGP